MESLALLVVIILAVSVFSGPIALFLTWLPILNSENTSNPARLFRRIFVTFLTVIGSLMSFNLFIASAGFAANLMAVVGSLTAFFAVKREYFPNGFGNKFGGGADRRNGPDGQH
jgi:energy-converting hydrogenase Eha subunit A